MLLLLGGRDLDAPQQERLRGMMLDDLDRLSAFIDDVLQSSRLSHDGDTFLNLGDFSLHELILEVTDATRKRHGLPAEAIVLDVPESLRLTTDRPALLLVVKNLIDNAVKYSNEPIRVDVTAKVDPRQERPLCLTVSDNGIGIPRRELSKVFHRFYRVDHEKVRTRKGTGLGLFVVYQLVRNLGGSIRAESDGVGKGSRFVLRLPITATRKV